MRRKDRQVTDQAEIDAIFGRSACCRLGLVENGKAYIVPLNFGFERRDGKRFLYFHCANEGRKLDLIARQPNVSFELDCAYRFSPNEIACRATSAYQCVMGEGVITVLKAPEEKRAGLDAIMRHLAGGGSFSYEEAALNAVCVLQMEVTALSSKEHE